MSVIISVPLDANFQQDNVIPIWKSGFIILYSPLSSSKSSILEKARYDETKLSRQKRTCNSMQHVILILQKWI